LATLCHEHAGSCKLPELDPEASIQVRIEKAIDKKFDSFNDGRARRTNGSHSTVNAFFLGLSGTAATKRDSELLTALQSEPGLEASDGSTRRLWFCLPCDTKDEVHSQPPNYRHIHSLQYNPSNKPPRIPSSDDVCHCVDRCSDDCMNKMLYTECFGELGQQKSSASNCRVGPNCGNRQLGQRKAAVCKPVREKGKGWGLITLKRATKGDLVQEYIGEVVDAAAKEQRLTQWSQEHPNDPNFYVMELQPGWFIDARDVSNLARFVNHSCEPNCRLLQINVNGRMRCGIFALRDIEAGEFLSYDYHFDTRHGDRFVCCCGSPNCRGTMKAGSVLKDANAIKSKAEVFEVAKANYERDKKFLVDYEEDRLARRTQVGILVPGADSANSKDELVSNGPHVKHKDMAQSRRIFLWRNAMLGCDFASRFSEPTSKSES
jgi:SET domain